MYGDAAGIDGRHTRGGHDGMPLGSARYNVVQEGRLAGACFAGQEHRYAGLLHIAPRQFNLRVGSHVRCFFRLQKYTFLPIRQNIFGQLQKSVYFCIWF